MITESGLMAVALIVVWVSLATYGDTLFKSAHSIASLRFVGGAMTYLLSSFLAFWGFKLKQWGWTILLWNSISLGLSLLLSVVLFGEPFTIRRKLAAALVVAALLLAE